MAWLKTNFNELQSLKPIDSWHVGFGIELLQQRNLAEFYWNFWSLAYQQEIHIVREHSIQNYF